MRHHCNLRDLAQGGGILADEQASEPYFVSCRFSLPVPHPTSSSRPLPHTGVVCLNAKSRHCRSGYLCEHALVKHSSIWPVSRPISSTRSPRRVSPAHATRKITRRRRRQENALQYERTERVETKGGGATDNCRNHDNVCVDILLINTGMT